MRKKISILLTIIIFVSSFCIPFMDVQASSADAVTNGLNALLPDLISRYGGYIFSDTEMEKARNAVENLQDGDVSFYDSFLPLFNSAVESGDIVIQGDNVKVSEGSYKQLGNWLNRFLDSYFSQEDNLPDLVWIPVMSYKDLKASQYYSVDVYQQSYTFLKTHDLCLQMIDDSSNHVMRSRIIDISESPLRFYSESYIDSSFVNSITYLTNTFGNDNVTKIIKAVVPMNSNGQDSPLSSNAYVCNYSGSWEHLSVGNNWAYIFLNPFYNYQKEDAWGSAVYTVLVHGEDSGYNYIPIFRSANAYKDYVTGNAGYYKFTPQYQGGDVVIDPDIDYGQIYDAVKQGMLDSVENGEKISNQLSHMQDVYNQTMQKLLNISEDIADNTAETNSLLEQIYKRLNEGFLESGDHFTTLEDIDRDILSHLSNALNDLSTVLKEQNTLLKNNFSSITDKMGDLLEADNKLYEEITQGFSDLLESLEEMKEIMSNFSFTVVDSGGGSGDSGGGDSGKKSFWTRLGELASLLFTTLLDLVSMILFKFLDGVLYLVNVLVDNASVAFDTVGTSLTNMTDRLTFGSEFFSEIYAHLPPEVTDLITLAISCFVIGGLISYVKSG